MWLHQNVKGNWTVQVLVRLFNKVIVRFSWLCDLFWGWVAAGSWFLTELEQSLLLVAILVLVCHSLSYLWCVHVVRIIIALCNNIDLHVFV